MLRAAMEPPAFASDRDGLVWKHRRRVVEAKTGEVTFTARKKWYLLGRWELVATSTLPLPVDATIYISKTGGAHGYWRNSTVISDEYFSHCDAPALVPLLIGPKTRAAIKHHDEGRGERLAARDPIAVHVRARNVETKTIVDGDDVNVVDEMLAIHKAIADDHTDVVDEWHAAADKLRGMVSTSWPPLLAVPRAFGSTLIALRWPASAHSSSSATIELSVDARKAKLWSMEQVVSAPNAKLIAKRPFLVMGDIPISVETLAGIVARAEILSINVRRHAIVRIAKHKPDPEILDDLLYLLGELCGDAAVPYR